MVKPAYRAGTLKRDRRGRDRMNLLDDQIIAVLREDHPQSVRHVFYRMTDPRLEAEAMPAATLRAILRAEVEALLPGGALEATKVAEQSERAHIDRMAALLPGG